MIRKNVKPEAFCKRSANLYLKHTLGRTLTSEEAGNDTKVDELVNHASLLLKEFFFVGLQDYYILSILLLSCMVDPTSTLNPPHNIFQNIHPSRSAMASGIELNICPMKTMAADERIYQSALHLFKENVLSNLGCIRASPFHHKVWRDLMSLSRI
jgi:hypothetical protein